MVTQETQSQTTTGLRFASALSRKTDTEAAVRDLADAVRMQLGQAAIHLAFVFFSPHHAQKADLIAQMIREELSIDVCLGCSGEGVIADAEELETAPALTLWVGCLPHVRLAPLRLAFSEVHDQIQMPGWPEPTAEVSTIVLLADPFTTPIHDVLSVMAERYPNAQAVGGLAGGGRGPETIGS
jgi:small ligand-binding sensory domain FIST